jgi:hypothetical protein
MCKHDIQQGKPRSSDSFEILLAGLIKRLHEGLFMNVWKQQAGIGKIAAKELARYRIRGQCVDVHLILGCSWGL